jgi:hypothetical protein
MAGIERDWRALIGAHRAELIEGGVHAALGR